MSASRASEDDRREHQRIAISLSVDCASGENFLFAYIENISCMGIFIRTDRPYPVGTRINVRFACQREPNAAVVPAGWALGPATPAGSAMPMVSAATLEPARQTDTTPLLELEGEVSWINPVRLSADNPNPGMGVRFLHVAPEVRERLVDLVHTVAYLRSESKN